MVCPDILKEKEEENRVLEIFKRDEILELVKLRRKNPEEYKRTLKDVAGVLKDIAEFAPKDEPVDTMQINCHYGRAWEECTPMRAEQDCSYNGRYRKCP